MQGVTDVWMQLGGLSAAARHGLVRLSLVISAVSSYVEILSRKALSVVSLLCPRPYVQLCLYFQVVKNMFYLAG